MKKLLLITAALFSGVLAFSQQEFQTSQYFQNPYVFNPAASGLTDYIDVNLNYRQQWSGFNGAPQTYYLTANSLLGKGGLAGNKFFALRTSDPYISLDDNEVNVDSDGTVQERKTRHAIGGSFMVDKAGAFKRSQGAATYAIHLPVSEKLNVSFGVKVGINSFAFDQSLANTAIQNDVTYSKFVGAGNNSNNLDVNFGLLLYGDKFYVGYSTGQLLGGKLQFGDNTTNAKIDLHHYINGAYRFELTEKVGLTPAALLKLSSGASALDLSAKVDFQRKFWAGFSVRPNDAFVTFVGLRVNNFINLGYSYDYNTTAINKVSNGSHEFLLNIMLAK